MRALRPLALVLVLGLGAAPALANDVGDGASERVAETVEAAREILRDLGTPEGREPAGAARRLAALGEGATPALFEILSDGLAGPGGPQRREAVLGAFRLVPGPVVAAHLRAQALGDEAGLAPKLRALDVIRAGGAGDALPLLLDIAQAIPAHQIGSQAVSARLRPALADLLRADPRGYADVEGRWGELEPMLREMALDAIESVGRRASVRSLGRLLGRDEATDLSALRGLGRIPLTGVRELDDNALFELEPLLGHDSVAVRRAAAHAAGRFRHVAAVDVLVEHLEDEDAGVRVAAAASLGDLTGLPRAERDARRWRTWIEKERAWLREEAESHIARLREGETAARVVVLRSVAKHRLHAALLWRPVAALLDTPDVPLRVAACDALGRLHARDALPRLVEALSDRDPAVAAAADAALVEISGRPSPGDRLAWEGVLDLSVWD